MNNVTIYPCIKDTVKRQAERFCMMHKGYGATHMSTYQAGAQLILDLIKSGQLSINQIN